MIVTLYGSDSYRRLKKLKELVDSFLAKNPNAAYGRGFLETKEDWGTLEIFLANNSIFTPKKLFIIDEPFEHAENKEFKKLLKKYEESKDTFILLNTTNKFSATFKFLEEDPNELQEYPTLKNEKLNFFIQKEAKSMGFDIDRDSLDKVLRAYGTDLWGIMNELERISFSKDKSTEDSDIIDYFSTFNTLKAGYSLKDSLVALERLITGRRDDPARVFNGLAFRPKNKKEALMCANYDVCVKSGKLEYDEALLACALGLETDLTDL